MDASSAKELSFEDQQRAWRLAYQLCGVEETPLGNIPHETLRWVIEHLYRNKDIARIPGLFTKIVNIMNGKDSHSDSGHSLLDPVRLKTQGETTFDRGIGINTFVTGHILTSKQATDSVWVDEIVLLLEPRSESDSLVWGRWRIEHRGCEITRSHVGYLDEDGVREVLAQYPLLARNLIFRLYSLADNYSRSLQQEADMYHNLAYTAKGVTNRIKW